MSIAQCGTSNASWAMQALPMKRRELPSIGFARLREAALARGIMPAVGLMGMEYGPWRPLAGLRLPTATLVFIDAIQNEQIRRAPWPFERPVVRTGKPGRPPLLLLARRSMNGGAVVVGTKKGGRPDATRAIVRSAAMRAGVNISTAAKLWALALILEKRNPVDDLSGRRGETKLRAIVFEAREEAAKIVERMRGK